MPGVSIYRGAKREFVSADSIWPTAIQA